MANCWHPPEPVYDVGLSVGLVVDTCSDFRYKEIDAVDDLHSNASSISGGTVILRIDKRLYMYIFSESL